MRQGFVFITDALISLLFASIFLSIIYSSIPIREDVYKDSNIYDYSIDLLTMLDKGGYLYELADKKIEDTQQIISQTQGQYCFYLRVTDSAGNKVVTIKKHRCKNMKDRDYYVRRLFFKDGRVYIAELSAWYDVKQLKGEG